LKKDIYRYLKINNKKSCKVYTLQDFLYLHNFVRYTEELCKDYRAIYENPLISRHKIKCKKTEIIISTEGRNHTYD